MTNPEHDEKAPTATGVDRLPQLVEMPVLARRLSTSERHLRRLVAERRIPFVRVGRLIRFDPAEVAEWLREHAAAPRTFAS